MREKYAITKILQFAMGRGVEVNIKRALFSNLPTIVEYKSKYNAEVKHK